MIIDRYQNRRAEREIETELYQKIATASLDEVRRLIEAGANPNAFTCTRNNDDYYFIIHQAALNPDIAVLKYIVSLGVDPCTYDFWERQPLAFAVRKNPIEFARYLVEEHGNDPKYEDADGGIAMAEAALNPNVDVLDYLLDNGAEINGGAIGSSPLEIAVQRGAPDRVAYMLDHGADMDCVEDVICFAPMKNLRLLLDRGFNPNEHAFEGGRIIDYLDPCRRALFEEYGGEVLNPDAEKLYLRYPDEMPTDEK